MEAHKQKKLGELLATAICGNGILSSTLYVSGITIIFAGVWAPLVMLVVAGVLWLYKAVYTEVVEALPLNGGAYNCLLNGTSKTIAAVAGIMTFLSYIATAVISATIGIEYLSTVIPVPIVPATIALLLFFALLTAGGIKNSAKIALGIFILHIATLAALIGLGVTHLLGGASHLADNLRHTQVLIQPHGLGYALYLAFSAALLGVSGFENSANFVEEQEHGVFRKTLRNMLIGVAIFNPLTALIILGALPYDGIRLAKEFLLANVGTALGGPLFGSIVALDALLVLSGAVLAAYIGVSGLVSRMAGDNCLPSFLDRQNARGGYPAIAALFFICSASILFFTGGDLFSLAGVYAISFLGVMCLFAIGNLILRESRPELKRTYRAPFLVVLVAGLTALLGIFGTIRIDDQNLTFFEFYFIPAVVLVLGIIYQDYLARFALRATQTIPVLHERIAHYFRDLIEGRFVAFIRAPGRLYDTLAYINRNETGRSIVLVCCRDDDAGHSRRTYHEIEKTLHYLHEAGVFPHLAISLTYRDEPFGPAAVDAVAHELGIAKNRIFIGSLHESHHFEYEDLGGARIIF